MRTHSLKALRNCATTLCLFAGVATAQAQLQMTFLEDTKNGHLSIVFSGQTTAIFDVARASSGSNIGFTTTHAFAIIGSIENPIYTSSVESWSYSEQLPLTHSYNNLIFAAGIGGFYATNNSFQLASTTSAPTGGQITWDAILTYVGDLAGIGLELGDFGTLIFTKGADTMVINWDTATVVPEPSTYALVLGAGVAGIALLRRRASR